MSAIASRAGRPKSFEPAREIGEQHLLAAEQMRGAGDIEKEAVGAALRIETGDGGRIARRPQRELAQGGIVGGGFGGANLQKIRSGARIRQPVAGGQSFLLRGFVQRCDAGRVRCIDGQNERARGINRRAVGLARLRREKAQDRPARKQD